MDFTFSKINIFVLYTLAAGVYLFAVGMIEILFKERAVRFWLALVHHRFLFLYGAGLTLSALPLTAYEGYFSPFIFAVGVLLAVMGPVIFIYPGILKKAYTDIDEEEGVSLVSLVKADGTIRLACGLFFISGALLTIFM